MKFALAVLSVTGAFLLLTCCAIQAAVITDLQVVQPVTRENGNYQADSNIHIHFALSDSANVTVLIARHENGDGADTDVMPDPVLVRTISAGKLGRGQHEVTWDGLAEKGEPVTETRVMDIGMVRYLLKARAKKPDTAATLPTPADLIYKLPVNLFQITVKADQSEQTCIFSRLVGIVPNYPIANGYFTDGLVQANGDLLVMNRATWHAERLSPQFQSIRRFPAFDASWSANVPGESNIVREDSKGNVYCKNRNGIYKFNPDGSDGVWATRADYLKGCILGVRMDPGHEDQVKKPGYCDEWGGFDIDAHDNLYLVKIQGPGVPIQIDVFDSTGAFLRSIILPPDPFRGTNDVSQLRFDKKGRLWVGGGGNYRSINLQTGAVEQQLPGGWQGMTIDSAGNFLCWARNLVERFGPDGKPLPFTAPSPYLVTTSAYLRDKGSLDIKRPDNLTKEQAPAYGDTVLSVIPGLNGDFYVLPQEKDWYTELMGNKSRPALHFDSTGSLIEQPLDLRPGQMRPGNVFVGNEPADIVVHATNLSNQPTPLSATWTLTDLEGNKTTGHAMLSVDPLGHETLPIPLALPDYGWYKLDGNLTQAGKSVMEVHVMLARIRPHDMSIDLDSPFCMVWGTNYYLSGIQGVKKERVGIADPAMLEPADGVWTPDVPGIDSRRRGGMTSALLEAKKWGVRLPVMLTYGEPWLTEGWMAPIYSYDRWLKDFPLVEATQFGGPDVQHLQFWNEPCNFLYNDDGKFNIEHYMLLTQLCWNICKSRDKGGQSIPDGDDHLEYGPYGKFDIGPYMDALPTHYPGAENVTWTTMNISGLPEGKAKRVLQLIAQRDQYLPGKPVLNTEEGWWGHKGIGLVEAASVIPRVYLPQIAAGVDEIYWFAQSLSDDPTYMLGANNTPWPAYCSYAAMTEHIGGTRYLGTVDLATPGSFAFLFGRGNQVVMALWAAEGTPEVTVNLGEPSVSIYDSMDRESVAKTVGGKLTLKLGLLAQYLVFSRNDVINTVIKAELQRQLNLLKITSVNEIQPQAIEATKTALTDNTSMTRLYYLVKAAEQAALAGMAPKTDSGNTGQLSAADSAALAKKAVTNKEGADGYLRQARVALTWVDRLERTGKRQGAPLTQGYRWATSIAAQATQSLAANETPDYPGATVTAFIGDPGEIERIRATDPKKDDVATRIDSQFRFQINRRPGETFELELTIWNFYKHSISGTLSPRLPQGWTAPGRQNFNYNVNPGDFQRMVFTINVPADTKPGVYSLGGSTNYRDQTVREVHAQRVKVTP